MAVTANQTISRKTDDKGTGPIASAITIYEGTMVFSDADGRITSAIAAGVNKFEGVADKQYDNSAGAAGALDAEYYTCGAVLLTGTGFTQGTVQSLIYASDNYTVTTSSSSTSFVGVCVAYESTTQIWVRLMPGQDPQTITTVDLDDDAEIKLGTGDDASILFSTGDASNHTTVIAVDDTSQQIHITDLGAKATDWARSAGTHPEVAIHSNTTPATDYLAIGNHDGTTADIDCVGGTTLTLSIAGTASITVTAAGATFAGSITPTTHIINSYTTTPVAAAGTTVADAGQLPATDYCHITSDGATKGVKLPTGVKGMAITIVNDSATACELYAASGGTVNGAAADASVVITASLPVKAMCTAADTWVVYDLGAVAAAS